MWQYLSVWLSKNDLCLGLIEKKNLVFNIFQLFTSAVFLPLGHHVLLVMQQIFTYSIHRLWLKVFLLIFTSFYAYILTPETCFLLMYFLAMFWCVLCYIM